MAPTRLLSRALRPAAQVPLANAVGCTAIASLVMHFGRTAQMFPASFTIGVELACAGSLVMLRALFGRSPDTRVARVRALVLPPLVGSIVGVVADGAMHCGNHAMSLSLAGVDLGGGASELLVIWLLSGLAGLLGALLIVPQILALERARLETELGTPEAAAAAERLGVVAWTLAFGLALLAWALARPSEIDVVRVLVAASAAGVAGQWVRASRGRTSASIATGPYR